MRSYLKYFLVFIFIFIFIFPGLCLAKECNQKGTSIEEIRTHGWGFDEKNSRFIPANIARLNTEDVPFLKLK